MPFLFVYIVRLDLSGKAFQVSSVQILVNFRGDLLNVINQHMKSEIRISPSVHRMSEVVMALSCVHALEFAVVGGWFFHFFTFF